MHVDVLETTHSQRIEQPIDSREAAEILGCHFKTLERYARRGEIPGYFRLNRWYFYRSELDAWLRSTVNCISQSVRVN